MEELPQQEAPQLDEQELKRLKRAEARRREQLTYQFSAIAASVGVTAAAGFATYYRILRHVANDQAFPFFELACTLALAAGAAFGMEM
jgi:hypothetical protein